MVFFITKTKYCYALKLLKLLHFLDFRHFKETGRSVTGLDYFAYPMGPVPKKLYKEIKSQESLKKFFSFVPERFNDNVFRFVPKIHFDKSLFSEREARIMKELIDIYKEAKADNMTKASHERRHSPWHKVFNEEKKPQQLIPYEYILDDSSESVSKDFAKELADDDKAMEQIFGSVGTF